MSPLQTVQILVAKAQAKVPAQVQEPTWWEIVKSHTLYQLLATDRNILIVLGCWILSWVIGRMITSNKLLKNYKEHWIYGVKLVMCMAAVWTPGLRPGLPDGQIEIAKGTGISGEEIGYRIVLGIIIAGTAIIFPILAKWAVGKYLPKKLSNGINKVLF